MAYRYGEKKQMILFPNSIEDYISPEDPVRAYDAFIEALNFNELGIDLDSIQVGCPEYDPMAMLKLLVYGYSYGCRSSRQLEKATHHNISFIWLMGGLKPDHKTISNFRKNNKAALKKALKQCVRLCIKLELIAGNTLFVDGTKIRANASIKNAWSEEKCHRYLERIDQRIEAILKECESTDEQEQDNESLVKLKEALKDQEILKSKVKEIVKELKDEKKKTTNTVDADCSRVNSVQGSHAGYNAQLVVDEKHGLIVNSDVVSENNDLHQFANQIDQAQKTLGNTCHTACADAGYAETEELKKVFDKGMKVIVPSRRQISRKDPKEFDKDKFQYHPEKNCYICPEGHELNYSRTDRKRKTKIYQIVKASHCFSCPYFGLCTSSKDGRAVTRLLNEEVRQKLEAQYEQPASKEIYKLRQQKAELPFGHIKRNLKVSAFLLRGLEGVRAEMSLLATCFNVTRMINLLGMPALIQKLVS